MKTRYVKKGIVAFFAAFMLLILINCSSDNSSEPTPDPVITISGTINPFGEVDVLSQSTSQSIQVGGTDLTSNLNINATENFKISLNDSEFSSSLTISKDDANAGEAVIFVRFAPNESAIGNQTGQLSVASDGATTATLALVGIGSSAAPVLSSNATNLMFPDTEVMGTSSSLTFVINADNLESEINLEVTEGFQISLNGTDFTNALQIPSESVNGTNTIYTRFTPSVVAEISGTITISNSAAESVEVSLSGTGLPVVSNYVAFNAEPLAFGGGFNQSSAQTFNLHNDVSNIEQIKMYLQIDCPDSGCDDWDRFANIKVKDPSTDTWFEIGRYITPYWTGTQQLERGLEFDVTDFKSLLTGTVELRIYIENWTTKADIITVDFDYIEGEPDYEYYAVSEVLGYHINSIDGVPYGVDHNFDLDKQVSIPANSESTHLRTVISGWGHATPNDPNGRPCAEWCFRTHDVKINGANMFQHYLGPIGCASNPISNQNPGNWQPDRAGWCPGMAVPTRVDEFPSSMAGSSFTFEYDYEDWVSDGANGSAYYATSTYVVVKSNAPITSPVVMD